MFFIFSVFVYAMACVLEWRIQIKKTDHCVCFDGELKSAVSKTLDILVREPTGASWAFPDIRWVGSVSAFVAACCASQNAIVTGWSSSDRMDVQLQDGKMFVTVYKWYCRDAVRSETDAIRKKIQQLAVVEPGSVLDMFRRWLPTQDEIKVRAYQVWQRHPHQDALTNWSVAESELVQFA